MNITDLRHRVTEFYSAKSESHVAMAEFKALQFMCVQMHLNEQNNFDGKIVYSLQNLILGASMTGVFWHSKLYCKLFQPYTVIPRE